MDQVSEVAEQDAAPGTRIDVVSDVICPWCYIGKRQLERALSTLEQEGLRFSVNWNPFQLNPDMPAEGRDRAAYRTWKFGSLEKSKELREKYGQHVVRTLQLLGDDAATAGKTRELVMDIETALAKATLTRVEHRDPYKVFHRVPSALVG